MDQEEFQFLQLQLRELNDYQSQQFYAIYANRRKDPQTILLVTLLGFVGLAGVQRFLTNQIGMGILFVLTGGLCLIGTIVDLVNYRRLSWEYNQKMAIESSQVARGFNG